MSFDVESVRAQFPALQAGAAHFDGPGGSPGAAVVGEAVAATLLSDISNRGHVSAASSAAPTASCSMPGRPWQTCSAPTPRGGLRSVHDRR